MQHIDPTTVRQVWSRVTASPDRQSTAQDWARLIFTAAETSVLYQSLSAALTVKPKSQAQQLWETQQDTLSVLRGLARLAQKNVPGIRPPKPPALPAEKLSTLCFHRAKEALTEYTARTIDPEFGPVFRVLARREEEACAALAALLGNVFDRHP